MATPQDIQSALEKDQARMRAIEAAYLRAKDYEKSLDWQQLRDDVLAEIEMIISPYFGDNPTQAAFKCGQIKQAMLRVQKPLDVIAEYESLKRKLETYYKARS